MLALTDDIMPLDALKEKYQDLLDREHYLRVLLRDVQTRHLRGEDNKLFTSMAPNTISDIKRNAAIPIADEDRVAPGQIEQLQGELQRIYDVLEDEDSEYVDLRIGRPIGFTEIKAML